ncbi:MAG TPA: hypothetical protein GX709_02520 [Clostridiales bacterium]|nr:hypothetical protein [Clostridiales bacterium]
MKKTKNTIFIVMFVLLLILALVGCTDNKTETEDQATVVGIEAKLKNDTKFKVGSDFEISKIEVTAKLSDNTSRLVDKMSAVSVNNNVKFLYDANEKKYKPSNEGDTYMLDGQMKFITEGTFVLTVSFNGYETNIDLPVYSK